MGGILADGETASPLAGLYSVGECSSVGIHGANRLGSNSLTELIGLRQGGRARRRPVTPRSVTTANVGRAAEAGRATPRPRALVIVTRGGRHRAHGRAARRDGAEHGRAAAASTGSARTCRPTCDKLAELKQRYQPAAARRPLAGVEHRVAARDRARLPARRRARRSPIRRSTARNRAARTSGSTGSSSATTPISSSTRSPTIAATDRPRSATAR